MMQCFAGMFTLVSEEFSSLRGGGSSSETIIVDDLLEDQSAHDNTFSNAAVAASEISQLSHMTKSLSEGHIEGSIDGVHHISAWTCGDGACGLHALFGSCSAGQLYAP